MNIKHLEQIIEMLLEKYPNKLPTGVLPEGSLGILIGRQEVINYLLAVLEAEANRK